MRFFILLLSLCLFSCNKKPPLKIVDYNQLLVEALVSRNFTQANLIMQNIKTTENMQNIISLYSQLELKSIVQLDFSIRYLNEFYAEMSETHQHMLDAMAKWVYLKQIYQHEISPPVRILQRNELYLAPSNVDFDLCPSKISTCAFKVRNKISKYMTKVEIRSMLKSMAIKDPCVNLTNRLQGHLFANKCLKKNKGHLKVSLLSAPSFNHDIWRRALSSEN
jgi:hypothetical protein